MTGYTFSVTAIQPLGSFLETNEAGYIENPTAFEKIQSTWLPAVEEIKQAYIDHYGPALHSVYLRGSVAKGVAIEGVSDVDTFAVVSLDEKDIDSSWAQEFERKVKVKYPFVTSIEIGLIPLDEIPVHKADQIMIKTQSLCLYGQNLADSIPPFKPGLESAQHIRGIKREVLQTKEWLLDERTEDEIAQKCSWIMKRIVRSGFELVIERAQRYTRDLYPCYITFSEYYPEKKEEMHEVLSLAVTPVSDKEAIIQILDGIGTWIGDEVRKVYPNIQ